MYAMPAGMQALLGVEHRVQVAAYLYQRPWPRPANFPGPGPGWTGAVLLDNTPLPVEDGTLTIDDSGAQRRRASLTVSPQLSLIPTSVTSALTPFRNMVVLYYQVTGLEEDSPQYSYVAGCFTLTDVTVSRGKTGDVTMNLELQDFSQDISRRVLTQTYVTPNGQYITTAVRDLIESAAPGVVPSFQADYSTAATSGSESAPDILNATGYTWDPGQDPWEAGQEMAQSIGMQLFFTPVALLQMSFIPNPATTAPCWTYADQQSITELGATGTGGVAQMTSLTRTFSQSQVYNLVEMVVESANSDPSPDLLYTGTAFLATAQDTDPTSPTYAAGYFGQSADVYYDQFNYQSGPALTAAKALLRQGLGAADVVQFTALPNPAHECYDVVKVMAPDLGLGTASPGLYVIDTVELPLVDNKDMTITARRVVNVP